MRTCPREPANRLCEVTKLFPFEVSSKLSRILPLQIFKMFSRPGTEDTESDLLRFQEEFLAGRLNPSAAVVRSNTEEENRSVFAGNKRVSPPGPSVERDVVTLEGKS